MTLTYSISKMSKTELVDPSACQSDITAEDFRHFYLAKSYDVIGQGTFRRHLCKCKESGDPWAVDMNLGVTKVHLAVKAVQSRIAQIPKPRNAMLQSLCRNVMVGAQPPIRYIHKYVQIALLVCIVPTAGIAGHAHTSPSPLLIGQHADVLQGHMMWH